MNRVVRYVAGGVATTLALWALVLFVTPPTLTVSLSESSDSPDAEEGTLTREFGVSCTSIAGAGWPSGEGGHAPAWDSNRDAWARTNYSDVSVLVDRAREAADGDDAHNDIAFRVGQSLTQRCDQRRTAYVAGMALLAPSSIALLLVCLHYRRDDRSATPSS